jgi:hypothetical protein
MNVSNGRTKRRRRPPPASRIRVDPTGSVSTTLDRHVDVARRLHSGGALISNRSELALWRRAFSRWRDACAVTLGQEFEQEAAREFLSASTLAGLTAEGWRRTLQDDVLRLSNAIELLIALSSSLGSRGASPKMFAGAVELRTATAPAGAPSGGDSPHTKTQDEDESRAHDKR